MFRLASSGLKVAAGRTRSSIVIVGAPPVVMLTTQPERCLTTGRKRANASGVWSGRPSPGSRACRWTIAAPASAAPTAASAICSGVTGRCGDMEGVWMAPVTAQVMMTLRLSAISRLPSVADIAPGLPLVRGQRHEAAVAPALTLGQLALRQPLAALPLHRLEHRPGPVDAALHALVQLLVEALVAAGVVGHPARGVEVDSLERAHET